MREVSSHKRARSILIGALVLIIVFLALFLIYRGRSRQQEVVAQHPPLQEQLKPFVGQWYAHWGVFAIKANGDAQLIARTYRWCGSGVAPPCDALQGNVIVPGINEQMQFTSVIDSTASGKIIASTQKNIGATITITLGGNDTLTLSHEGVLCGPKAKPGLCGA
jgi:hypothetical protein